MPLSLIEEEPSIDNRLASPDRVVVRVLTTAFRKGHYPPPILVYRVKGPDGPWHVLIDGRNRILAAKAADETEIMAEVRIGSLVNAAWAAACANKQPAQGRTAAEEARAIQLAIGASPGSTAQAIAEHVGVSVSAVLEARRTGPADGG